MISDVLFEAIDSIENDYLAKPLYQEMYGPPVTPIRDEIDDVLFHMKRLLAKLDAPPIDCELN
jgi:hypothetical protein